MCTVYHSSLTPDPAKEFDTFLTGQLLQPAVTCFAADGFMVGSMLTHSPRPPAGRVATTPETKPVLWIATGTQATPCIWYRAYQATRNKYSPRWSVSDRKSSGKTYGRETDPFQLLTCFSFSH